MSDLRSATILLQAALDAEAAMEAEPAADGDADDVANNQADREAEVRVASHCVPGCLAWDHLQRCMMQRVHDRAHACLPSLLL